MSEGVSVRPARPEDLGAMAAILVEGFRHHFEAAFKERVDRAERALARVLALETPRGLPGLYVAELHGQVVGTMALRRREDADIPTLPSTGIFVGELGLFGGLRAMFYLSLLDQPCGRSDVYVADVAVAGPVRRQGVAQAMLAHAEKIAHLWKKHCLVLDVEARNEAARQLYRRLGYTEERERRSLLTRWLLGIETWVRMYKRLT